MSKKVHNGKILCGVTANASELFGFSARQIHGLWAKHGPGAMDPSIGISCAMKPGHGHPRTLMDDAFNEKMCAVPFSKRQT